MSVLKKLETILKSFRVRRRPQIRLKRSEDREERLARVPATAETRRPRRRRLD
jgi:hypothetical protein